MNFINPDAIINLWANNRQQQLQEHQIKNVLTEQPQIVQSKTPEPENEILKYQGQNAPHVKDSFSTNFLKKQVIINETAFEFKDIILVILVIFVIILYFKVLKLERVIFKNNIRFEITTFRMEINYSDNRQAYCKSNSHSKTKKH